MIALRAALARRRAAADGDESGFALVFTLLVITLVSIMVAGAVTVTASNIKPAAQSAYSLSAQAAAQAGVDAYLATLNASTYAATCSGTVSVTACTPPAGFAATFTNDGGYTARYSVAAVKGAAYFRVTSTGTVTKGNITASRTLVADLTSGASTKLTDYAFVSTYETQSPDVIASQYPNRAITEGSGSATWNGAGVSGGAGSVNICNSLYQGLTGRSHNTVPGASTPYVDWAEGGSAGTDVQPCQVSLGNQTKLLAPVNGTGGYATQDALLLSNSYPGGSGPLLKEPVYTGYQYDAGSATACDKPGQAYRSMNLLCAGYAVQIGGSPSSDSTYAPLHVDSVPSVPTATPTVPASGACVYTGPTRVRLNTDGTATITSPATTSAVTGSPAGCYPASLSGGIYFWTSPVLSSIAGFTGVISVRNSGAAPGAGRAADATDATTALRYSPTGWSYTGQRLSDYTAASDKLSYLRNHGVFYSSAGPAPTSPTDPTGSMAGQNCTSSGYSATAGAACAWSGLYSVTDGGGWNRYTSGTGCSSSLASTDRLAFECDFNGGSVGTPHDYYGIFRDRVRIDLERSTCLSGSVSDQQACLKAFLTSELNPANTSSHRYTVTADTPVSAGSTKTLSSNAAPGAGDDFFDSSTYPGSPTTESLASTAFSFTVNRQVYKCYGVVVGSLCLLNIGGAVLGYQWGSDTAANASTAQFKVTVTNQTATLSSAGSTGATFFPYAADATQYARTTGSNAPGDLYVEGTATTPLGLVAANDAVITGNVGSSGSGAVELVARDDVRVYHPVKCTSTPDTATTAGFCPGDTTGLYAGPGTGTRPDKAYANLRPDLSGLSVNGIVYALGGVTPASRCPQPRLGTAGVCGGQFGVDNYDRGDNLGTLTVTGTVAMQHHGPAGREWEIADATGQGSRPYSGYQLNLRYQGLTGAFPTGSPVPGIVSGTTSTTAKWRVVSVSTGGTP